MAFPAVIRCTLSGSFRRDSNGLKRAYQELVTCGCQVLSPHRLDFDSTNVLFVKDSAERDMSEVALESHHLMAIRQSDFVWVHTSDGYVGPSTAFEIGYANAHGVPVFATEVPNENVFRPFVSIVPSVYVALESINTVDV